MKEMNSSSVDFELYVWVRGEEITKPNRTKSDFLKMIYTSLNDNNIQIPFPQTDLHIKDSIPLEVKLIDNKEI
jgi:potassium efflux system protein